MSGYLTMKSYAQNQEDVFVLNYFKSYKGNLLSVGENDGQTFSNARLLIEQGWSATLIEPSSVFGKLFNLYQPENRANVRLCNYGIGEKNKVVPFYESGAHVPGGTDRALVSSTDLAETQRWRKTGVQFTEKDIQLVTFKKFWDGKEQFDFISLDTEGHDWSILQQIDLNKVGCRCLCIEWNGNDALHKLFTDYCAKFGLGLSLSNRENLIFVR